MSQEELKVSDNLQNIPKQKEMTYINWKLWWWNGDDKKHIEFIKQPDLDSVIAFCNMRGIKKYSVFDSKFKNICNDGIRTLLG